MTKTMSNEETASRVIHGAMMLRNQCNERGVPDDAMELVLGEQAYMVMEVITETIPFPTVMRQCNETDNPWMIEMRDLQGASA